MIDSLVLFDVLEPVEGQFGFRDLRAAREAGRLLRLGFGLDEIAEASVVLRQHGRGLHDTAVTEAPWGELMQTVGGRTARPAAEAGIDGLLRRPQVRPSLFELRARSHLRLKP